MENTRKFLRPVIDLQATGLQIKSLRKESGYSVRDLQDIFGFEFPQAIYAWEQGKNVPTIDNLLILAKLFNVSIEDLVSVRNVEITISCSSDKSCDAKKCESCKLKKIA